MALYSTVAVLLQELTNQNTPDKDKQNAITKIKCFGTFLRIPLISIATAKCMLSQYRDNLYNVIIDNYNLDPPSCVMPLHVLFCFLHCTLAVLSEVKT